MDLKDELALTYLFISHDLNLVAYFSDCIGVMYQGRLMELGSTEEIMKHPCHPYTLKLFSSIPGKQAASTQENDGQPQISLNGKVCNIHAKLFFCRCVSHWRSILP